MLKFYLKILNYLLAVFFIFTAVFLAYIVIPQFGNKALIVRSISMEPTIKAGDLLVVSLKSRIDTPQNLPIYQFQEGEIVAFKSPNNENGVVTHRIVKRQIKNGTVYYETKGDASKNSDAGLISQEKIIGKTFLTLPVFGSAFAFAKEGKGLLLLVIPPLILAIITEFINLTKNYKTLKNGNHKQLIKVELEKNQKTLFWVPPNFK